MDRVLFRCPKTSEEFDSGFEAGQAEIGLLPKGAAISLRCPLCAERHAFKFSDARIVKRAKPGPSSAGPAPGSPKRDDQST